MKAERNVKKKQLSKSILEMKFMKKSKEAAQAEQEDEDGRAMFASELTEAMRLGGVRCIIEPSFVPCEDLVVARQSYHGMNPEVEQLNTQTEPTPHFAEVDADVKAEQFALNSTIARKFDRGKYPPKKKARFLKPADD